MSEQQNPNTQAQVVLPSSSLPADIGFFEGIGFRLLHIFPADDPAVAILFGHGMQLRLDRDANGPPALLHLVTDAPQEVGDGSGAFTAPNGTVILLRPANHFPNVPQTRHQFEVRQLLDREPWVVGRAGMLYRDLIPGRLGGSIIASHIRIPKGGPVPDMVHFHTVGFQLIYCYRGWVRLVYEDQGPPFVLKAGDCVTQPPQIRHRVLESSDNLEVVEIGVPAAHLTTIDHEMHLPTPHFRPERQFQGQRFCHHRQDSAEWLPWRIDGFECRDSGIQAATNGIADVRVVRPLAAGGETAMHRHDADILFSFVLRGQLQLAADGEDNVSLGPGDAFVVPPGLRHGMLTVSGDCEWLEVALPGAFGTLLD